MPANRVMTYATRLRATAAEQGLGAVWGQILASIRWRFSAEGRLMRAIAKENWSFDKRYGTDTSGEVLLQQLGIDAEDAKRGNGIYRAIPESHFVDAIAMLDIPHGDYCFVDYGAGKGKALLLAMRYAFRSVIGVEWAPTLCEIARQNISDFASRTSSVGDIAVVCDDATAFSPPLLPLVCFFFNPFDAYTWRAVIQRIENSWIEHPRPIYLVYVNVRDVVELGVDLQTSIFKTSVMTRHCWILSPRERNR